jgi:chorismate mutase
MEDIQDKLEMLIDEMEEDNTMPKSDILLALYRLKEDLLSKEEGLQWEDLD